jgi:glycosyltransferase involved in cell wall biosynthesis
MTIGIDISQLAYGGTGVANYLENWLKALLEDDKTNNYILFFSSLRNTPDLKFLDKENSPNVRVKIIKIPPTLLEFIWNKMHIYPIERIIGPVDLFITSDWVEPPAKAKKATIIYDLIIFKHPEETHNKTEYNPFKLLISPNIVKSQKRKLHWVKKESDVILTISESSKKDIEEILKIDSNKIKVIYPGL